MAGLDPAIQIRTAEVWMPGSRPGMTQETWYKTRKRNAAAEHHTEKGLRPSALHALLRHIFRASEIVGFELTEFEAPSNAARRARAVQTVIRMIEPVFLAGPDRRKRVCEPCAGSRPYR
jgi:hypothetical protein